MSVPVDVARGIWKEVHEARQNGRRTQYNVLAAAAAAAAAAICCARVREFTSDPWCLFDAVAYNYTCFIVIEG